MKTFREWLANKGVTQEMAMMMPQKSGLKLTPKIKTAADKTREMMGPALVPDKPTEPMDKFLTKNKPVMQKFTDLLAKNAPTGTDLSQINQQTAAALLVPQTKM